MRLHEIPIQEMTLGIEQIHSHLQNLCLELQSLKKEKETKPEVHEEVWCLKCKFQRRDKYHCPVFANYIIGGGPIPLKLESPAWSSMGAMLWYDICQVARKHATDNCHFLQKFVQTSQQLFCDFCKSVGHDEQHCHSYELMMERMPTYQMQE